MEIEFILAAPAEQAARFGRIEVLRQAYARGPRQVLPTAGEIGGYWFARFGVARQADWPAAPFRLDAATAGNAYWLCADPIHLQLDHDRLLFDPQGVGDLSAEESQALLAGLNPHLAGDGMALQAVTPARWVLRVPRPLQVDIPPPALAAGMPAATVLPQGQDAGWVRRLSSELQMLLHQSPVNAERESHRHWPVNSLWLWGGGVRPQGGVAPAPQRQIVFSSQPHVRELCRAAGGESADLPAGWAQLGAALESMHYDKALIDLTEITLNGDWEAVLVNQWLAPAALAATKQNLTFWGVFTGLAESLRVRLYGRDLFHFFRRKSLAQYLEKSQNQWNQ